jgi:glycosyltransferase involved in cell wall biosynthesis
VSRATVAPFPRHVTGNPYCDLLYGRLEALGVDVEPDPELRLAWLVRNRKRVGVLHLHWPEFYYRGPAGAATVRALVGFLACMALARALGYRIVWTIHNALPHEPHPADRFVRWVLMRIARTAVHSRAARRALPLGGDLPAVVPHGHYIGAYADTVSRRDARARLGVSPGDRVLLFFGQVRDYKGIADLVQAFRCVDDQHVKLVVAGRPAIAAEGEALRCLAAGDARIQFHLRFIPDDEVQIFFRSADFVVLPYREVLTSGVAILALSFGRPVVVPRLGCLQDLDGGCAISYDPADPLGLDRALETARRADPAPMAQHARSAAAALEWDDIARAYRDIYGPPSGSAGGSVVQTSSGLRDANVPAAVGL